MKKIVFFLTAISLFVIGLAYKTVILDYKKSLVYDQDVTITIPYGASAQTVSRQLEASNIIPNAELFYWIHRIRVFMKLDAGFFRAGEYAFPKNRSLKLVHEKLLSGDVIFYRFTIPEGLTSREIKMLLKNDTRLVGLVPDHIEEGSLLAETYTFSKGDSRKSIILEAQKDLNIILEDLWSRRPKDFPLTSKSEVLVLASIVEKETAIPEERPLIAAVFLNRLKKGMPLQTDPTIIYAFELETGADFTGALTRKHLEIESPYNTYKFKGLVPSPICHVGLSALLAVMKPEKTDALFFVADGTGGHVFSKTYADHQKNHEKWRKIRSELRKKAQN